MMGHGSHHNGSHHNCTMCRMAKATGMMEKHSDNCNCQEKQEQEQKHEHGETQQQMACPACSC